MSTTRQNKVSRLLQKDLGEIFQNLAREKFSGTIITVTNVRVTPDLGVARVYLSIFPSEHTEENLKQIKTLSGDIKQQLVQRIRHQVKNMPELQFMIDDSLDYIDNIDRLLND